MVIAGPELGRQIDLASGEVDIGRDEDVTLRIDSELVSRRHASIRRFGTRFAIADLDSTNGTFVNDRRIQTHSLAEGDLIRIGKVVLKFTESEIEARYHEQIVQLANADALTGAYNKRYFEERLRKLYSAPRPSPLCLVLFDIDHFKEINDTHGHAAGDAVLRQMAEVVRGQLRDKDTLCRVGGEEFAVIMEGADVAAARKGAEFIRGAVDRTVFEDAGKRIPVTVSLGVAEREATESTPDLLYKRADEKLYAAKRGGRNRVE